ncbi:hypothetical protein QBK93_07660 [Rhizobium leguminosarum]|uniref:hypothetical protein n=1 Tax=Rhizobium leguminosarum TaxID=384 RepID=UPI0024A8EB39|nr:hypothetical protein [Rhizobium leguminosarum]MDI5924556.1 hypothetical protein [Rhizobium leguminosarum]
MSIQYWDVFKKFSIEILKLEGYVIVVDLHDFPAKFDATNDLDLVVNSENEDAGVQLKFFRESKVAAQLVKNGLMQLAEKLARKHLKHGLFITSLSVPQFSDKVLDVLGVSIQVWDLAKLTAAARTRPDLLMQLEELLRVSRIESASPSAEDLGHASHDWMSRFMAYAGSVTDDDIVNLFAKVFSESQTGWSVQSNKITTLVTELNKCPADRAHAEKYERLCEEAIRELFGGELGELKRQHRVADGFHRPDIIASIKPRSDFWINLRNDFRSRYVVFEIKNYSGNISQDQIYTTEKYLFTNALRSIAIIIARNGEDAGAKHARQGALREAGKLMLVLDENDIVKMLVRQHEGEEYMDLVAEKLDDLLTTMAR